MSPITRQAFLNALKNRLAKDHEELNEDPGLSAADLHRKRLTALHNYTRHLFSHRTCFCCLLQTPEKPLTCGHTLCDVCIRLFGKALLEMKYLFALSDCPLCGMANARGPYQMIPPTAGIRVLSLDGGGIRGIVLLVVLQELEKKMAQLQVSIREYFDFVCGTSSGK